jgi:hypothetical protein
MAPRLIALLILLLSLLPISNLIPGGEVDVEYWARMLDWANGLALCAGVGALAMYVATIRRRTPAVGPEAGDPSMGAVPSTSDAPAVGAAGRSFVWITALLSFGLYAVVAHIVFSARPLLIDEIVQVLQGRWYAAGHLTVPTPQLREFFSILHLVDLGDRTFGQFPPGGPAMLALGTMLGAEWIVGPLVGAGCVVLFAKLLERLEPETSRRWHRGALVLFAIAPFGVFMFGSHMNHATTLFWLLAASVALAAATERDEAHPGWGFSTGLALGIAASIRPVDAAAFALPAAGWLLWRARRGGRPLVSLLLSGVGIALPLTAVFWVNLETTGRPLLFGYELLWGAGHGLGFHRSPWGPIHTPWRGLELVSLYFTRLSIYLFETPFPALLPAAAALWFSRRLRPLDRYLFVSSGLVVVGYWAYWHDGFYLGPRFMLPLLPALIVWTARFPLVFRERLTTRVPAWLGMRVALWVGALYAAFFVAVVRIPQYRNGMTSMRVDIDRESAAAGVHDALVLVKESWGAQLVVRLWARGVSRSDTEVLYRNADACKLELTLTELERSGTYGAAAREQLLALQSDSALLVKSTRSPDFTERLLPGYAYAPACEARLLADQSGFSHLAPLLLAQDGNVYARWMPGRESEIAALYPDRPVFLLERAGSAVEAPFIWRRLRP